MVYYIVSALLLMFFWCPCMAINVNVQYGLGGANPAVNTPRPSRGTRIESCDFIVLIGDP